MNKYPPEILIIFLYAMIQLLDVILIEKAQDFFLQLPAAFAWNDFNERNFLLDCLFHDAVQFRVNLLTAVVDVVQVELEFCHYFFFLSAENRTAGVDSF
jgi:hypothetical protein